MTDIIKLRLPADAPKGSMVYHHAATGHTWLDNAAPAVEQPLVHAVLALLGDTLTAQE